MEVPSKNMYQTFYLLQQKTTNIQITLQYILCTPVYPCYCLSMQSIQETCNETFCISSSILSFEILCKLYIFFISHCGSVTFYWLKSCAWFVAIILATVILTYHNYEFRILSPVLSISKSSIKSVTFFKFDLIEYAPCYRKHLISCLLFEVVIMYSMDDIFS